MKSIELIGDASDRGGPRVRTFSHEGASYYVVSPGDTYWSIASDELGSAALATDLWEAQSEAFRAAHGGSMNRLAPGDVLRLPKESTEMEALTFARFYGAIGDASSDVVSVPTVTVTPWSEATQQAAGALQDYLQTHTYEEHEKIPQVGSFQQTYLADGGTLQYGADEEYGPETNAALQAVLTSMGGGTAPAVVPGGSSPASPSSPGAASKMPWGKIAAVGGGLLAVGGVAYGVHRMMR